MANTTRAGVVVDSEEFSVGLDAYWVDLMSTEDPAVQMAAIRRSGDAAGSGVSVYRCVYGELPESTGVGIPQTFPGVTTKKVRDALMELLARRKKP
jgi:hypothetical protein